MMFAYIVEDLQKKPEKTQNTSEFVRKLLKLRVEVSMMRSDGMNIYYSLYSKVFSNYMDSLYAK